jgi:hypothetical protein
MENNERILIGQNNELLELIKGDIRQFDPAFNKLTYAFAELGCGGMTAEVFNDIKSGQERKYVQQYKEALEKELNDTKVINHKLRTNLLQGTDVAAVDFLKAVNEIRSFKAKKRGYGRTEDQVLSLDFISVENGHLVITKQDEEAILETYCRHYLTTDEEKAVYTSVNVICNGFEELEATCRRFNIPFSLSGSFAYVDQFVSKTNGQIKPNAERIIERLRISKLATSIKY